MSMWTFLSFSFPSMSSCPITSKFLPFNFTGWSSTKGKLWALLSFCVQTCKYKCRCMVPIPLARFPVCGEGHPDTFQRPALRLELVTWAGYLTLGSPRHQCGPGRLGAELAGELPPAMSRRSGGISACGAGLGPRWGGWVPLTGCCRWAQLRSTELSTTSPLTVVGAYIPTLKRAGWTPSLWVQLEEDSPLFFSHT